MEEGNKIILLDLNYTLVGNSVENKMTRPWTRKIRKESYREWLLDLVRDEYVILITARPEYQKDLTLDNIEKVLNWQPQEAYFNEIDQRPPACKERILSKYIFPKHGEDANYFAIESNPQTKRMYGGYDIPSVSVYKETPEDKEFVMATLSDATLRDRLLNNIKYPRKVKKSMVNKEQKTLL